MHTNANQAPLARTVGARREHERRGCTCCTSRQTPAQLRRRERRQTRQALRAGREV
jgi:hypothetical protein